MTETRGTGKAPRKGLVIVIAALTLLVLGAAAVLLGTSAASSADDDLAEAEAALDDAEGDLSNAEDDRDAAQAELDDATANAESTLGDARTAAELVTEICDCDGRVAQAVEDLQAAANSGNQAGVDAAFDALDAEADTRNAARDSLEALG